MKPDYLIIGSGLSALVFGALMAKSGKKVQIIEAHEYPGGFGHTFPYGKYYKFNAQLHYVWGCGEGQTVNRILKHLNLDQKVTFEQYDPKGYDHMKMPGYSLEITGDNQLLISRLSQLFPKYAGNINDFILEVETISHAFDRFSKAGINLELFKLPQAAMGIFKYLKCTLQDVFDQFGLPKEAQTLLALQWPDFLLPPNQLSFHAWILLFTGYQKGAFYPTKHFEHVINSLVEVIEKNDGKIIYNQEAIDFVTDNKTITSVITRDLTNTQDSAQEYEYSGKNIICNMDPKKAAEMIGADKFSTRIQKKLNYDYSASNFMAYCAVKDIDLEQYGFGKWNVFHTGSIDLNETFQNMFENHDYSNPSFAICTPGFLTKETSERPDGQHIIEFLTVADYNFFKHLKDTNPGAYKKKKKEILNTMIDIVEQNYIPDFRKHLAFKITGSPTTNERYCWCPQGNSYGSTLIPENMSIGRLNHKTSLKNMYFCNASSGFAGFAGTFWTGAKLYQKLSGDRII
ncbi:MAG: NAD(P)-binding protein [gamma proteobacterium symbiont of Bathyaustriella thionipta]|nr:NAD(P)-binding protein [gamma proteobacterium symbiont of Bathyaustriella thionipta]MCU7950360.1 NAD(P)-binding protein [gamma proteobacterium symbiont of Bathyaustriella thionipta]MCU7951866.1 NAD(P)-binding protein [gamma proteobacterium symbiont of Bathyaustriella thionipta]MCU7956116.1 NAD(P)-binding protein [gamma proteobacterium symbiont of Bathyaustriella thionipta]MCU7966475.1 NAD(P)-binding protein [gamma proteobacterium symbiont of Bathyaustriella thionipta]